MIFDSLIKPKEELTTLPETATINDALKVLEETGYRCVPILDPTGKIFRGNIYKLHIYRHKSRNGNMNLPVTVLLKNATKFISINDAFFKVFFTIKDLPYIAVLDSDNHFYGILTHTRLLRMLAKGWNVKTGSYVLSVTTERDERGNLVEAAKEISHFCSITNVISLDVPAPDRSPKIMMFTLEAGVSSRTVERIKGRLHRHGFTVAKVEDLHPTNFN
ncbi:MAG TPA: CBS domain-containing protein [Candidatus Limosilactobacillus merdipullorum]|uniref:CBS domain-containing protein n=1 Tax=Candidatus Limosilactobacillus merdipullorum TaxID=2838653 RepID=A0A9D1QP54_9LACO|nr:CBS domain-containing protein [Candidatus Limosilactobacillus merdipullorum]